MRGGCKSSPSFLTTSMVPDLEAVAEQVFVALADPTRRAILTAIASSGPATVSDLAGSLPVTRQAIAKHLVLLSDAGLIVPEPGRTSTRPLSAPLRANPDCSAVPRGSCPSMGRPARRFATPPRRNLNRLCRDKRNRADKSYRLDRARLLWSVVHESARDARDERLPMPMAPTATSWVFLCDRAVSQQPRARALGARLESWPAATAQGKPA